jgi:hypothetical protein
MPFASSFDSVLDTIHAASSSVDDVEIDCRRIDESARSVPIDLQLEDALQWADFVIADVTGSNPNVMWELGYAVALQKPVIILAQIGPEPPFNLAHYRMIRYDGNKRGTLLQDLTRYLKEIVKHAGTPRHGHPREPDFDNMTDKILLDYLERTIPLHGAAEEAAVERFINGENILLSTFLVQYRNAYKRAVRSLRSGKLPLPSFPRQQVAITALRSAKRRIRAITVVAKDQWLRRDTPYFQANIDCAPKNNGQLEFFRRIVVYQNPDLPDPKHPLNGPDVAAMLHDFEVAGIELQRGFEPYISEFLDHTFIEEFRLQNVLIVDDTVMTRADEANHGGTLITAKEDILMASDIFDSIWDFLSLQERPRPRSS